MINVGIVGLGFMAATHIKAFRRLADVRIGALCNPSGRHLDGDFTGVAGNVGDNAPVKLEPGSFDAYLDFTEMLVDPELQLIDICAPTPAHPELAIAALKAGKHVLCEKPLARTSQLARQIVESADGAKGFFMPAMCMRFWPEWAWVKTAIDERTFGQALGARFRRVAQPPGWGHQHFLQGEKSGGALLDLHIHDVDFVQFCFGRPSAVHATGYSKFSGAIDHVVAQYHFDSGAMVHAEGAWAMAEGFGFSMSYTVNFENATADYDIARGPEALKLFEKGKEPRAVQCEGGDGYEGELKHLLESIRAERPPTIVTARDGQSAVEICEAEERSIKTGQTISL